MRRIVYSTLLFLLLSLSAMAQNGGINFQGMARNAAGEALANQKISLRLSVLLNSESGTVEYSETKEVTTSGQGIFSVVVGDGNILTKTGNFSDINWKNSLKFLKVELDPNGGTNFALMGTSRLQAVPFAYYANGVDAENVQGTLPVAKGGTGVASITALKTSLGIDQVSNTSDANKPLSTATQTALNTKVDKVTGKELSSNDFTTAEKTKLAAITGTNTGDQDLSGLATTAALATKANTSDVTTSLALKANTTELTAGLAGKVDKVTGKELSTNDFTTAEKNKLAAISGTNTGDQDLSGLATTAALATKANTADVTTSLALKENAANKSTDTNLGGNATSDDFFPTQKAVKTYVDGQVANGGIQDGAIQTRHIANGAVSGEKLSTSISGYKNFIAGAGKVVQSNAITPDLEVPHGQLQSGGTSLWQSFTAGVSGKLWQVEFETRNSSTVNGPSPEAFVEIYNGSGISGTRLGFSPNVTISGFGRSWKTFDLGASNIELISGNIYTARLIISSSNQDWVYGGEAIYNSGISNVSSTWDHNLRTNLKPYNNDPFLTTGEATNLYGGLVSNATHIGEVTGSTTLTITDAAITNTKIADGAVLTSKLADGAVTSAKIGAGAINLSTQVSGTLSTTNLADGVVTTPKLANNAVDLGTKVTGELPTANLADGSITTAKLATSSVDLTSKVTGVLPVENGGTGESIVLANTILAGPNGSTGGPSFRTLVSADIPTNLGGYIQNNTNSAQSASIFINGPIIGGSIQNTPIGSSSASSGAFTTLTTSGNTSVGGTLGVAGVATFSAAPILSTASASKALFTDSNKRIVSNDITGSGNVVMSASPTLTGTISIESISSSKDLSVNGITVGIGSGNKNTNTAIGVNALQFNTTGERNIAVGYQSLLLNSNGLNNVALGYRTLSKNSGGNNNIGIGYFSLSENTSGNSNIGMGQESLFNNTTGSGNVALGFYSLKNNQGGSSNIAIGNNSLLNNSSGSNNFAAGELSLFSNTNGNNNLAIGNRSLVFNLGSNNIGFGNSSLYGNQSGINNFAAGYYSLYTNSSGSNNVAIGLESLRLSVGDDNIGIGKESLKQLQGGNDNISIGNGAGKVLLLGSNNIIIGPDAQPSYHFIDDEITLGNSSITSLRAQVTSITSLSDRRDKTDIVPIAEGLDFIKQLKPVTFTWNTRDQAKVGIKSAGFIAQDLLALQKASPIGENLDLVSENNPEKLEARYNNLLPVLVKAIQDQQQVIEDQKTRLDTLEKLVQQLIQANGNGSVVVPASDKK